MKVKLKDKKKLLPRWDSFCGLGFKIWERLNSGKTVAVKFNVIPKLVIPYLEIVKSAKKPKTKPKEK